MADMAKVQLREQMGLDFDDVERKQYEPRQYDPRHIVREALMPEGTGQVRTSSTSEQVGEFKAPFTHAI
jgi:hypothetical protein